ncbi:MAG TPA: hypothetical protein VM097_09560 [Mycobacteriales bacterium]|nr:hypothetical protein [Mycobacteriales bacterium]
MTLEPGHDPDRFDPDRLDPDRFDPDREKPPTAPDATPLDPAADPDRYRSPTLPGLLGDGAQEDERNNVTWLIGLVSVFAFLAAVSLLVRLGNGG